MAVAKSPPTPSTRIRDNQRRSRARRKEYIHELEERIRKFERLGAQASTELQAVALKVARENAALRGLLMTRGVTAAEIETYMKATPSNPSSITSGSRSNYANPPTLHESSSWRLVTGASIQEAGEQPLTTNGQHRGRVPPTVDSGSSSALAPLTTSKSVDKPSSGRNSPPSASSGVNFEQLSPKPRTHPLDQGESSMQNRTAEEDDATSCETAAWIIANLRGHDDAEEVRAELGCTSNMECNVKNLTVFNAMDR